MRAKRIHVSYTVRLNWDSDLARSVNIHRATVWVEGDDTTYTVAATSKARAMERVARLLVRLL